MGSKILPSPLLSAPVARKQHLLYNPGALLGGLGPMATGGEISMYLFFLRLP